MGCTGTKAGVAANLSTSGAARVGMKAIDGATCGPALRTEENVMARNNRKDGKRSSWFDKNDHRRKTCGTCGGSGSRVDAQGEHVDACRDCRGWGQVDK